MGGVEIAVGNRGISQGAVLFRLAKQELSSMSEHLRKRPPDEAAALAALASSLQKMCAGLDAVATFLAETNE